MANKHAKATNTTKDPRPHTNTSQACVLSKGHVCVYAIISRVLGYVRPPIVAISYVYRVFRQLIDVNNRRMLE